MFWRVVSTEAILVVSVIDSNLDRYRCVDQPYDCGRYPYKIGVATVGCTCKSSAPRSEH